MSAGTLAVIGAGWAGLAAAVRATEAGRHVTLFDMAPRPGGRARTVEHGGLALDNGQHILIGAYRETLALMRTVGAAPERLFDRRPLALLDPAGHGLLLPPGPPVPAFVRAVLALRQWPIGHRWALLRATLRWRLAGFRAAPQLTVAELTRSLPPPVCATLIEPLCVAALNTPAAQASAAVFLRVLRDALFGGPGASDLLLPRRPLSALLPQPADRWLAERGSALRWSTRVQRIEPDGEHWRVDGAPFAAVVLACTAPEAARLAQPIAPHWAARAGGLGHEPIITVYLASVGTRLNAPMLRLPTEHDAPAQFAFDLGALDRARDGLFAFVVSGARDWVEAGLEATQQAVLRQADRAFPAGTWREPPVAVRTLAERRATFLCAPGLDRPPTDIAPGLAAAGDYVQGPYPATIEGAVRSAGLALRALGVNP